jgi:hypothetical protein
VLFDNTYLVYDEINLLPRNDNAQSIKQKCLAGYINYNRTNAVAVSVLIKQTDATGDLKSFLPELRAPVQRSLRVSAGIVGNYQTYFANYG